MPRRRATVGSLPAGAAGRRSAGTAVTLGRSQPAARMGVATERCGARDPLTLRLIRCDTTELSSLILSYDLAPSAATAQG